MGFLVAVGHIALPLYCDLLLVVVVDGGCCCGFLGFLAAVLAPAAVDALDAVVAPVAVDAPAAVVAQIVVVVPAAVVALTAVVSSADTVVEADGVGVAVVYVALLCAVHMMCWDISGQTPGDGSRLMRAPNAAAAVFGGGRTAGRFFWHTKSP